MSLTQIVVKEDMGDVGKNNNHNIIKEKETLPMIYSPKLGKYIPLNSGNPKGEIQKYNVGMGPGSWY